MNKNMHIITLSGPSNTGKSTSLKKLIKYLETKAPDYKAKEKALFTPNSRKEKEDFSNSMEMNHSDYRQTFSKEVNGSLRYISIWTGGDAPHVISKGIEYGEQNKADILIIASRTNAPKNLGQLKDHDPLTKIIGTFTDNRVKNTSRKDLLEPVYQQNVGILYSLLEQTLQRID